MSANSIRPETRTEFRHECKRLFDRGFVPVFSVHEDLPEVRRGIREAYTEFAPSNQIRTANRVRVYAPKVNG